MSRRFVETLSDGDNVDEVFLVVDKQLRANRNGNYYIQLDLGDRSGKITGRMWNAGEPLFRSFDAGDFLFVKGKVQLFQGNLQLILNGFDKFDAARIELTDFLPHTKHDISKLLDRLKTAVRKVGDPHLRHWRKRISSTTSSCVPSPAVPRALRCITLMWAGCSNTSSP